MNNRDIELFNLRYDAYKLDTETIIFNLKKVNIEKLMFGLALLKYDIEPKVNYNVRTKLLKWMDDNNYNRSEVINNYFYYKEYIKYILMELYNEEVISYEKGDIVWRGQASSSNNLNRKIMNLIKNANESEIRKVLNEN